MPPRKKPNPSAKFSIQHFFERHTQNSQIPKPPIAEIQNPLEAAQPSGVPETRPNLDPQPNVDEEASPEISKTKSAKRFKFSPGMLIKQSQDEGGEEVTWRTSPVDERLKAVSRYKPEMMRVLADASRLKSSSINQCSQSKTSGPAEKSLSLNRVGVKRVKPDQEVEHNGNVADRNVSDIGSSQSPFKTPPSLSYCHDKLANAVSCDGVSDEPGSRQHKKVLQCHCTWRYCQRYW